MISPRDEAQRRMLSNKAISPRNTKFTSIANRSPTNRFENKTPITNATLSSKKQLLVQNTHQRTDSSGTQTIARPSIIGEEQIRRNSQIVTQQQRMNGYGQKNGFGAIPEHNQIKPSMSRLNAQQLVNSAQCRKIEGGMQIDLPNGDRYIGQIENKRYHGKGQYYFKSHNLIYFGDFIEGKQHGQGHLRNVTTQQIVYQGTWQYGQKHGNGRYSYNSQQYYNGQWRNNQRNGTGYFMFVGGSYSGQWNKNKAHGIGHLKLNDQTQFKGKFEYNQFIDGTIKYPNGDQYYGKMKNHRRNSQESSYTNFQTKMIYKGAYFNDLKHGKGTIRYPNGDELTGMFKDGALNQYEVATYKWNDGTIFQGWFKAGKPDKGTVTYTNGTRTQI